MGIDEARNGDPVGTVYDFGAAGGDRRRDRGDLGAFDQDIALMQISDFGVDGNDRRVLDERTFHGAIPYFDCWRDSAPPAARSLTIWSLGPCSAS